MLRRPEMTYDELFNLFKRRNVDLSKMILDYRPHGEYALQIWLKNGYTFYVRWIEETQQFVFGEIKNA